MDKKTYLLEEHEEKMTIYYRKQNGEIKMISDGIHDMSIFGCEECDYELIWDCIVVPLNPVIKDNPSLFVFNLDKQEIQFNSSYINPNSYKVG